MAALPNELLLIISKGSALKDQLSFADTCAACRPLISEAECIEVCTRAGLIQVEGVSARAMAKLLFQPRVGVCNWSLEGGIPKNMLDFTETWSIYDAITEAIPVDLHPVFNQRRCFSLREAKLHTDTRLQVAPDQPEIILFEHRLYTHEFLTHPPLREFRCRLIDNNSDGPLQDLDVAFCIYNPTGVTLGNYFQALYEFLYQTPDPNTHVASRIIDLHRSVGHMPSGSDDNTRLTPGGLDERLERWFLRTFPTNLEVLNTWCTAYCDDIPFSDKCLATGQPLYTGSLESCIFLENFNILGGDQSDTWWGQPLWGLDETDEACMDVNREFWKAVPAIRF